MENVPAGVTIDAFPWSAILPLVSIVNVTGKNGGVYPTVPSAETPFLQLTQKVAINRIITARIEYLP
jgi:hypothetical protein